MVGEPLPLKEGFFRAAPALICVPTNFQGVLHFRRVAWKPGELGGAHLAGCPGALPQPCALDPRLRLRLAQPLERVWGKGLRR